MLVIDWMKSTNAKEFRIVDFQLEGQLSSDKKLSWGNVQDPRGVQVLAWGKISNSVCQRVLGCTTARFHQVYFKIQRGSVRNGQMGQNANTANVMAAMFIACGQDAASVLECGWSHLTAELDNDQLTNAKPILSISGGWHSRRWHPVSDTERGIGTNRLLWAWEETCLGRDSGSFCSCFGSQHFGAFANDTFAKSHEDLARAAPQSRL